MKRKPDLITLSDFNIELNLFKSSNHGFSVCEKVRQMSCELYLPCLSFPGSYISIIIISNYVFSITIPRD